MGFLFSVIMFCVYIENIMFFKLDYFIEIIEMNFIFRVILGNFFEFRVNLKL